ncbi:phosphodiesterase [Azorhizobium doebereinerae]|uniref:phosphodiesterase n=1 Tax=Azorhizobium doebereinerae TaxID=281091 RepID=UPI0003F6AA2E|nr:phosphodiesterase [Azorhizobium doebereinerae]
MLIAQLTDTHVRLPGRLAYGVVDTGAYLERAAARLRALSPRPDVVLVTGDLTDFDKPEEYGRFRSLTAQLPMPIYPVPGNHDSSTGLRAAFPEIAARASGGPDSKVNYVVEEHAVRLVMLDSSVRGKPHGELGRRALAWLDGQLAVAPERPTLIALHHPPFLTGIRHMDVQNLADAAALEEVVAKHPQVLGLVCGHVHRAVTTSFAGRPATIGPAPAHAVSLALGPDAPPSFHMEPPAMSLHRFADGRLATHTSFIGPYDGPYPFFDAHNRLVGED